jgi:ferredoxin
MKVLYFTATGNNLYIAKRLGGEYYSIPKLLKEDRLDIGDEKIGIVFPVFYSGVPKIVEEFLNKSNLKSNYIFAIGSYGSLSWGTSRHLMEIGKRNGIEFSYYNEILMVDNYLPVFDMDKELKKEPRKNVEENLNKIINDIEEQRIYLKTNPVFTNVIRSHQMKWYDYQFEKNFSVGSNCNGCKACEKVCPVDNIKVEEKPVFNDNCQHCLACIHNCPQMAISLKKEKGTARFRNQNVTLNEIINANS